MKVDNPMSREDVLKGDIIEDGIYPFEVLEANDTVSSTGNEMIKLKLKVYMPDNSYRIVFDNLMNAMKFKMGQFCYMANIGDKYESGDFEASDCLNVSGECHIYSQKSDNPKFDGQPAVKEYILDDKQAAEKSAAKAVRKKTKSTDTGESFEDDDVAF